MNEFTHYLIEVFESFAPLTIKRMFGGYGVFHNQLMIGLVDDDVLYLKSDADAERYYREQELPQFEYHKQGKLIRMSYFQAPESIYDSPEEAACWASRAYAAAQRADKKKQAPTKS